MQGRMTLMQLMDALRDEGVDGEEYEERVAEFIARRQDDQGRADIVRRGEGAITRKAPDAGMIPFPTSAQDRGIRSTRTRIPVDYGDESPAEAEDRWRHQEMEDPNGVYSMGGSTAGGIFGSGPISSCDFDPGAHQRAAPVVAAKVQIEQLQLLKELGQELRESREENRLLREKSERGRLGPGDRNWRLLGRKKK